MPSCSSSPSSRLERACLRVAALAKAGDLGGEIQTKFNYAIIRTKYHRTKKNGRHCQFIQQDWETATRRAD